jgi:putative copper export protein/methionine-rich copper-binding protein CopC
LSRFGRTDATLALVLLLAALLPLPAAAHQRLLGTEPARESVVSEAPRSLRLVFYEPVDLTFTRIELIGPTGESVRLGPMSTAPDSVSVLLVPIEGHLRAGAYSVRWATASRDGHPVRSEYGFSIAEGAAGLHAEAASPGGELAGGVTAPGQRHPPAEHHPAPGSPGATFQADSPGYVLVRWATYLALLGVIGAAAFSLLVLNAVGRRGGPDEHQLIPQARRRAALAGLAFTGLLVLALLARLYAQSLAMHGSEQALDGERVVTLLRQTLWGWGWILQAAGALLVGIGFLLARRGSSAGWGIAGLAAVLLAISPALSGHAATMTGVLGTLAVIADALHVLAAGGWLGTLLILLLAGLPAAYAMGPARRGPATAALVRAFSPVALMFAGLLILTGVFATVVHSSSLAALLSSRYGTLLFIKLGIFLLVFGTGAYNFLRVKPALGNDSGTVRLRRSAGVELALAAAILLVTSVLVATARPFDETTTRTGVEAAGSEMHTEPL